jgi:hypothetical protein
MGQCHCGGVGVSGFEAADICGLAEDLRGAQGGAAADRQEGRCQLSHELVEFLVQLEDLDGEQPASFDQAPGEPRDGPWSISRRCRIALRCLGRTGISVGCHLGAGPGGPRGLSISAGVGSASC